MADAVARKASSAAPARTGSHLMMASAGSKLKHQISSGLATSAAKKDSESDDGDDDDEDEDEDESGDDEEGEDDVLNFYGLDTLFPTKWTEIPAAGMAFAPKGSRASSQPSTPSKARLGMDDAVCAVDASDPLGIRETIFRRGKRRDSRMGLGGGSGPSVLIQEKNFDATFFLREIHKQTSHKDLEQGAVRLKVSIEQRDEVIKGLVKKYFAKFVSAKSTIDSFYREMRQKNLISLPDYGIAPFEKALENLETNANKLYGPVLGRRSNGDKIRIALSILEGWKFFFNLPSSLTDQIKKGKYDGAVRDFKKGKYLMQSSFTDESGSAKETRQDMRSGKDAAAGLLPKTHKAVFDKVWAEVDKIVGQLRDELFSKLGDPSQSVEAQEKLIGYLVDLDADKNPVRCFLERQYMWLVDQLRVRQAPTVSGPAGNSNDGLDLSTESVQLTVSISSATQGNSSTCVPTPSANATASATQSKRADELSMYEVKRGLSCVTSRNFELFFRNNDDAQAWKLTLRFIQELCSLLCSRLPDLCRVCKVYVDGKLGKSRTAENGRKAGQSRRAERVERMIRNITNLVRLILTDTFGLTMPFASILETFGPNDRGAQSAFSATTFTESLYPEYKEGTSVNTTENDDDFDARLVQPDISDIPALQARLALLVAHPLILAHYSTKVISVLGHMFSEIHSVAFLYEDALIRGMARSVTQVQLRLVESICEGLQSTSAAFYLFEDWSYEANSTVPGKISGSAMADCTAMVKLFYRFTKFIVRTLAYIHSVPVIAFVSEDSQTTPQSAASTMRDGQGQTHGRASLQAMRQQASDRIRAALLESQYLFLDGLQHLAVNYIVAREPTGFGELASSVIHDRWMGGLGGQGFKLGCALAFGDSQISKAHTKKLDIQSPDTRCFIILGNLAFQKSVAIPKFFNMLEAKSHALLSADIQNLCDTVDYLDNLLVQNYVRRQSRAVQHLLESGILFSGLDWGTVSKPQDVRPYCYQVLLHLVLVHASISEVSKLLVRRIMTEMLYSLANHMLMAYRAVDCFSTGGMLQSTLEAEFMHHTLKAYETTQTADIFSMVYDTIERSTVRAESQTQTSINEALIRVKGFLQGAKKSTGVQFLCFREGEPLPQQDE
ncbi:Exocyst complex component S5 [Polyrhizophydium stewartii]|uniref:Exocyst complex component SEC5 n=1 Tax=Polyrhizophydium stewartii TaxID=2732419 RepID=A0ABR4N9A1_9FUNG